MKSLGVRSIWGRGKREEGRGGMGEGGGGGRGFPGRGPSEAAPRSAFPPSRSSLPPSPRFPLPPPLFKSSHIPSLPPSLPNPLSRYPPNPAAASKRFVELIHTT